MRIKFISYLDVYQTLRLLFCRKAYDKSFYFDASMGARRILDSTGLAQSVKPFTFQLSEIKDGNGESRFVRIYGKDVNEIYNSYLENGYD